MERRELLKGAAAVTIAAIGVSATAADHEHHHGAAGKYSALIASTADCIKTGEACLSHCLMLLGKGNKELAACAQSVNELVAVCTALQKIAGQESRFTPRFARLVGDVCADCEKQCRKHEKHAQCKSCADACASCYKECQKLKA